MDEIVKQAMARWPDVPNCYGWLALDRRGQWRIRNEYAQQHGLSGDPVRNEALVRFIERNYQRDAHGAWYFQNGPQRVFVALGYAPWVARLHRGRLATTSGHALAPVACYADEHGNVVLACRMEEELTGASGVQAVLLHDHDLDAFSSASTGTAKPAARRWACSITAARTCRSNPSRQGSASALRLRAHAAGRAGRIGGEGRESREAKGAGKQG